MDNSFEIVIFEEQSVYDSKIIRNVDYVKIFIDTCKEFAESMTPLTMGRDAPQSILIQIMIQLT